MREVSTQLLRALSDAAVELGVVPAEIFTGLRLTREDLAVERRIDWTDYVATVDRLERVMGSRKPLEQVGARMVQPYVEIVGRLTAFPASPSHLYSVFRHWWAPGAVRGHGYLQERIDDRSIRAIWSIPSEQEDCPGHFHALLGVLRVLPRLIGLRDAWVQMTLEPRRGIYGIALPPSKRSAPRRRRGRAASADSSATDAAGAPQAEFSRHYRELADAHAKLQESEARHRAMTGAMRDIVIEISDRGDLLYVSPVAAQRLGRINAAAAGRTLLDAVHPDDVAEARSSFARVMRGEAESDRPRILRIADSRGEWVWFEVVGSTYATRDGEPRFVGVLRDVGDRVLREQEERRYQERLERDVAARTRELAAVNRDLRQLQTRLLEAERLGAGQELAGSVAHAINNPLAALIGTAEVALEARPSGELERILQLARRVSQVVSRTLALYQEGKIRRTREAPASLVEEVQLQLADRARAQSVEWVVKTETGLPEVEVDRPLFTAALVGIAENALDALPSGGLVSLEAGGVGDVGVVAFRVADTGPGIPGELRESVFEPFFTTKGGGTGLGLSIARGTVRGHAGRIRIDPRPGGGTLVTVEIAAAGQRPGGSLHQAVGE